MTNAEVRVLELRINDETRRLKALVPATKSETGVRALEGRIEGLNAALSIFREEFGKNGRTARAV